MQTGAPDTIPDLIDPLVFCERGNRVSGRVSLGQMERLRSVLVPPLDQVQVELLFSVVDKQPVITGSVVTRVRAECQRCLLPVELAINCEVRLQVVVDAAAAKELPEEWEPLVFNGVGQLSLVQVIEDEILVVLPPICLHEEPQCEPPLLNNESAQIPDKPNPFEMLAQLKKAD